MSGPNIGPDTSGMETGSYRISTDGYTAGSSHEKNESSAVFRPATQNSYDEQQWGMVHVTSEEPTTGQLEPEKSVFNMNPKFRNSDEYANDFFLHIDIYSETNLPFIF